MMAAIMLDEMLVGDEWTRDWGDVNGPHYLVAIEVADGQMEAWRYRRGSDPWSTPLFRQPANGTLRPQNLVQAGWHLVKRGQPASSRRP